MYCFFPTLKNTYMYIAFACPYVIDQKLGLPGQPVSMTSVKSGSKAVILYIEWIKNIK
jgi:hypothetical protein